MAASYAKLRDGTWGIRVRGPVKPGDVVQVTSKAGHTKPETVKAVVWVGDDVTLCSIVGRAKAEGSAPVIPDASAPSAPRIDATEGDSRELRYFKTIVEAAAEDPGLDPVLAQALRVVGLLLRGHKLDDAKREAAKLTTRRATGT